MINPRTLHALLLAWFATHERQMPWRGSPDPYAVWVSEVMLQQTQVATVTPYYERFLRRFPDVGALARARLDDVLKTWEGLGYYSRARNLHAAAKTIVADLDGEIPRTVEGLCELPGIGRYTAGAIASIAFGLDEPVLDGNVARVLSRVFLVRTPPKEPRTATRLWDLARELLPKGRAGEFNQALMDLGATVCTPRKPACIVCPIAPVCRARAKGLQDALPAKSRRKPLPHHEICVGVVRKKGRVLIDRRKPEGLLGGLWEFPGGKRRKGESREACVRREVLEELGVRARVGERFAVVRHAYSHFRVTIHAFECEFESGRPRAIRCAAWKWVRPREFVRFAFPAANRRIIAALAAPPASG